MKIQLFGILVWVLFSFEARSFTLTFLTDQASKQAAIEKSEWLKQQSPFNQFQLDIKIVYLPPQVLECKQHPDVERMIQCKDLWIYRLSKDNNWDRVFVVTDLPDPALAATLGHIVKVNTRADNRVMLHEFMHTFNFSDEYAYLSGEIHRYCNPEFFKNSKNIAFIKIPRPFYVSDMEARALHAEEISWSAHLGQLPITHLDSANHILLGSSGHAILNDFSTVGLFKATTCDAIGVTVYKPVASKTIMEDVSAPVGEFYEKILIEELKREGAIFIPDLSNEKPIDEIPTDAIDPDQIFENE